ncbi:MAG: MBL fold metallo-hydrolase [Myxococcota bacterium]
MSAKSSPEITNMPGVKVVPLRTPTLPPATHTNAILVGYDAVWIVDPASPHEADRARLTEVLDHEVALGRTLAGVVLTHHHRDHVGAARWLQETKGLSIVAHPLTRDLLAGVLAVDRLVVEGDTLSGSERTDDQWRVLHTPGHASGHIVLWEPVRRGMIAGDMVAAVGTIIVEPPDGHMATYIAQLDRLAALEPAWLVPAHGGVIDAPVDHLRHYISHRLGRETRVVTALQEGPADLSTMTVRSYPDVPTYLHPLAERSCLAHLIKLEEESRARCSDGVWAMRP